MIKREMVVDEVELNDKGETVAMKGKVVKVYEIDEFEKEFLSHKIDLTSINIWFWAQFELDYIGG